MSSNPNGPPVAYAYITNTNGSKLALRTVRVPLRKLVEFASRLCSDWPGMCWLEMLAVLVLRVARSGRLLRRAALPLFYLVGNVGRP